MKTRSALALFAGMCLLLAVACKPSTKDVEQKIRSSIEETLKDKSEEKGIDIKVVDFTLTPTEGDNYTGVLKTNESGKDFTYDVDVTAKDDELKWHIKN